MVEPGDFLLGPGLSQSAAPDLSDWLAGVNAACIEGVDDDAGASGAVDRFAEAPLQVVGEVKAGRDENHDAIAGQRPEQAHDVVQDVKGIVGLAGAFIVDLAEGGPGDRGS